MSYYIIYYTPLYERDAKNIIRHAITFSLHIRHDVIKRHTFIISI